MYSNSLRDDIQKFFGILLPISGGQGGSIDDPIVIEVENGMGVSVEYDVLKYIYTLSGKRFTFVGQSTLEKDGKYIDKLQVQIEGEPDNYRNLYFDISRFYGKNIG